MCRARRASVAVTTAVNMGVGHRPARGRAQCGAGDSRAEWL